MNKIEKFREKINYYKNSGMRDPFKEFTWTQIYLGMKL